MKKNNIFACSLLALLSVFMVSAEAATKYICMNNKENSAPKLIEMEYNKGENHYVKINGEVFLFGVERQETTGCKTKWFRASPQHILAITPTGKDNQVACKDTLLAIEINADKKWYGGCIPDTGK